jgi:hypothetical protein
MRRSTLLWVLGFLVCASAGERTALAEPRDSFYEFSDDDMLGDTISSLTAIVKVRPPAAKVSLIRPRASFVPEMLKSVEVL